MDEQALQAVVDTTVATALRKTVEAGATVDIHHVDGKTKVEREVRAGDRLGNPTRFGILQVVVRAKNDGSTRQQRRSAARENKAAALDPKAPRVNRRRLAMIAAHGVA